MTHAESVVVTGLAVTSLFIAFLSFCGLIHLQHKSSGTYDESCAFEEEHIGMIAALNRQAGELARLRTANTALFRQLEVLDDKVDGRLAMHENPLHTDKAGHGHASSHS